MDALLVFLTSGHLVAMNLATAGPLVCLWLGWRARRRADVAADRAGAWLAMQSVVGLTGGIFLGGLLLGGIWHHRPTPFFRAAEMIPVSRLWFGIAELAFSYVLLLIFLATWRRAAGRWWHLLLGTLAGTNILYHFPPLFASMVVLSQHPADWREAELTRGAYLELMRSPETLAHVLHFVLASFAVTGVMFLGFASKLAKREESIDEAVRMGRWGGWLGLGATIPQLASGLWLYFETPAVVQNALGGEDLLATGAFALAIFAALAMLPALAAAAFGTAGRSERRRAMILMAVTIILMTAARHISHQRLYDGFAPRPVETASG